MGVEHVIALSFVLTEFRGDTPIKCFALSFAAAGYGAIKPQLSPSSSETTSLTRWHQIRHSPRGCCL